MNKKIEKISSWISLDETVLDVGTDHGQLLFNLIEKGMENITACDRSQIIVDKLENLVHSRGLSNRITVINSEGYENIDRIEDYSTIVIAGVGYWNIQGIINSKSFHGRYILHPTEKPEKLTKFLIEKKFIIKNIWVFQEGKNQSKYSWLIDAKYSDKESKDYEYSKTFPNILMKCKDPIVTEYFKDTNKIKGIEKIEKENLEKERALKWREKNL